MVEERQSIHLPTCIIPSENILLMNLPPVLRKCGVSPAFVYKHARGHTQDTRPCGLLLDSENHQVSEGSVKVLNSSQRVTFAGTERLRRWQGSGGVWFAWQVHRVFRGWNVCESAGCRAMPGSLEQIQPHMMENRANGPRQAE